MAQKQTEQKDPGRRREYGLTGINITKQDRELLYALIEAHREKHGVRPRQFEMLGIIIRAYMAANG